MEIVFAGGDVKTLLTFEQHDVPAKRVNETNVMCQRLTKLIWCWNTAWCEIMDDTIWYASTWYDVS